MIKEPTHLLDLSVYLEPLQPSPNPRVREHWEAIGEPAMAIGAPTLAKALALLDERDSKRVWQGYRNILEDRFPVFAFDEEAAKLFLRFEQVARKNKLDCKSLDIVEAALARRYGLILATVRPGAFEPFSGLAVEDWNALEMTPG